MFMTCSLTIKPWWNFFKRSIVTLYTDNGGEYEALKHFLSTHGITRLTSPPYTPEHNGFSDCRHRHIVETGLTLLYHAFIPLNFWTHALATAVYLINYMPKINLSMISSFEKLFGHSPNLFKLRIFGCLCYPWLRPYTSNKLDARLTPCVFLGYSLTQSAYYCYDSSSKKMYVSGRHVTFVEDIFPDLPHSTTEIIDSWSTPSKVSTHVLAHSKNISSNHSLYSTSDPTNGASHESSKSKTSNFPIISTPQLTPIHSPSTPIYYFVQSTTYHK